MSLIKRTIDCDATPFVVSVHRCKLFSIHAINVATTVRYLKVYDKSNPTVGSDTPIATLTVPSSGDTTGGGFTWNLHGVVLNSGCAIACVTEVADSGTTGAGTNEVLVNVEIEHY